MIEPAVYWNASAVVVSAAFASFVFLGNPGRHANRFVAFFFLLIAGNQTAEIFRTLAWGPGPGSWLAVATVFAAMDPFFLYYFASIFPERNALNRPVFVSLVALPAVLLLAGVVLSGPRGEMVTLSGPLTGAWASYTATVYLVVLGYSTKRFLADPGAQAFRWLVPALCVVALPAAARLGRAAGSELSPLASGTVGAELSAALGYALAPVLVAVTLYVWAREDEASDAGRWVAGWALLGVLFAWLSRTPYLYDRLAVLAGMTGPMPGTSLLKGLSVPVRWLAFGSLLSAAVFRDRILDLSLTWRRRAARGLVTLWLLVGIGAVGVVVLSTTSPTSPVLLITLGFFAVAIVLTSGFQRLVGWLANRLYRIPVSPSPAVSAELYRQGVAQVRAEGQPIEASPRLERLREELGLDARMAAVVERMAGESKGALAPGSVVSGRYRVEEAIGAGASGRAFLASDELLDRTVVLKEILHSRASDPASVRKEARLAGGLSHPNLVTVHDMVERPGSSVLVTEHVGAGALADRLEEGGPLELEEGIACLEGILDGLSRVHERGIVHRDLKPDNVLLVEDGTPKIADFGIATDRSRDTAILDDAAAVRGTPGWMAPEQRDGRPVSPRTDIHAVGRLGEVILGPGIPDPIQAVLERARVSDPQARWASAAAMREALSRAHARVAEGEDGPSDTDEVPM